MLGSGRVLDLIDIWSPIFFWITNCATSKCRSDMKMAHTGTHGRSGGKNTKPELKGFQISLSQKSHETMFLSQANWFMGKTPNHPTKRCLSITIEWTTMYGFVIWSIYSLNIIHDVSCSSSITGFNNILYSIQPYNPPVQSTQLTTNWQLFFFNNSAPTLKLF